MNLFYLLAVIVVIGTFLLLNRKKPLVVKCPKCDSTDCLQIGVEQVSMSYYERPSGSPGGSEIMVKAEDEHRFRCNKCNTTFKKTIARSR